MIRHVIVFNATVPEAQVRQMAELGKRVLGAIPGVTDVRFGVAVDGAARYAYLFDIGFADESVVDSYRTDPLHVSFAGEYFRPIAEDRVTIDYRLE